MLSLRAANNNAKDITEAALKVWSFILDKTLSLNNIITDKGIKDARDIMIAVKAKTDGS